MLLPSSCLDTSLLIHMTYQASSGRPLGISMVEAFTLSALAALMSTVSCRKEGGMPSRTWLEEDPLP